MYKEIETYIKANCPQIFQLFSNAVESEEYMTANLVKVVDNLGLEREKAMKEAGKIPLAFLSITIITINFSAFSSVFSLLVKFGKR